MPEHESSNESEMGRTDVKSVNQTVKGENAWVKFERGQVGRRAALKKMGITTGMALSAMFSVDDLARMVGKAMEQRARDNEVAETVARELSKTGITFASPPGGGLPGGCTEATPNRCASCCTAKDVSNWCKGYPATYQCHQCCAGVYAAGDFCAGCDGSGTGSGNAVACVSYCDQSTPNLI